ncbi:DUF4197 domain-containing protein [Sediminibacterium ginsengisoli]|uniref:DUF4197 domain-containing protein n=1 Tax=Sediminibacterium ginsengisoli TaxID=413434 RepID=A0A1T4QQ77_9BACT|nr:DUF4197 domain-containing protein [Sediminibacterium ginsengisoli]SKA05845.1 Protein of unknown function [Sediminibacterium ginsengisoli]
MKKQFIILLLGSALATGLNAQGLGGFIKKVTKKDSAGNSTLGNVLKGGSGAGLSNDDIVAGLKEALAVGTQKGTALLSKPDGFFANAALKILLPPEAQKVESTLRKIGLGSQVDEAILSMNRAAEDACKSAAPIFTSAIKQMSFQDALGILKGSDSAATVYLKGKTTPQLTEAFRPVIESSLAKVNATKYWNTLITTYNKVSLQKINPDLSAYVTERALSGIFSQLASEEKHIRKDPVARTTDILKKVFGGS